MMDRIKMKKRMKMRGMSSDLAIACLVAGIVAMGSGGIVDAGDPIPNYKCTETQFCTATPQCPTKNGECDSCSKAGAAHAECLLNPPYSCNELDPEVAGCGVKKEGICDALDNCIFTLGAEICDRLACADPGPG